MIFDPPGCVDFGVKGTEIFMLKKFSKHFNLSFSSCLFDAKSMVPELVKWPDRILNDYSFIRQVNPLKEDRMEFMLELFCFTVEIPTFVFNFIEYIFPANGEASPDFLTMDKIFFTNIIQENISLKESILQDNTTWETVNFQATQMINCLKSGGTIWFCGNGGSAADAQHLAAELSGRFYKNRKAYASEALHVNSSFITAVANDFGYNQVFARAVEALVKPGDILVCLSTSGNSENILNAAGKAKEKGIQVFAWTGSSGGLLAGKADSLLNVPSVITPRIQEVHITLGHIICEYIEVEMEK